MLDLPPHDLLLWWADPKVADWSWLEFLNDDERRRCDAYQHLIDRQRFLTGAIMVRRLFAAALGCSPGAVPVDRRCERCGEPHGRVRLASGDQPIHVSLSHSGAWVVLAASRLGPVGVDVEVIDTAIDHASVGRVALTDDELAQLMATPPKQRAGVFTTYWTRKEAVVKATGDGLATGLRGIQVSQPAEPARLISWQERPDLVDHVHLYDIDIDERHRASVAVIGPKPRQVVRRDARELLHS